MKRLKTHLERLAEAVVANYGHRLHEMFRSGQCPVCAGDGITSDERFGVGEGDPLPGMNTIYRECEPCGGLGRTPFYMKSQIVHHLETVR